MRFRIRLLRLVGRLVVDRPWSLIGGACFLAAIGLIVSMRGLVLDADYNSLLPDDHASVARMRAILSEHGGLSHLLFVVDGADAPTRAAFADTLAAELRARPGLFESATSRLPVEWFRQRALQFLDPEELRALDGELAARPESLRRLLHAPSGLAFVAAGCDLIEEEFIAGEGALSPADDERATDLLEDLVEMSILLTAGGDAGNLRPEIESRLDRLVTGGRGPEGQRDERIVSDDGEALLVIARAARSTLGEEGRGFIDETMEGARAAIAATEVRVPGVRVRVSGPIPQQEAEEDVIRNDFKRTGRVAALLITVLLCVVLRLWIAPILAMVPLALSLCWTLALVTLTLGRLNAFSVMFVAIVLGLGIDFGIHLVVRYGEERSAGAGLREGIQRTIGATGSAVTTGAISTVVAFGALIFSDYPAFYELGWVAATGIGLAFVAFITILPSLLLIKDRLVDRLAPRFTTRQMGMDWLGGLGLNIERHPRPWAAALGLVTLASLGLALGLPLGPEQGWLRRGLRFQDDLLLTQPLTPTHALQREIVARFGMGSEPFYLSAGTLEEAHAWTDRLLELEAAGTLVRVVSPARFVPADGAARVAAGAPLRERLGDLCTAPRATAPPPTSAAESLARLGGLVTEMGDLAYLSGLDRLPMRSPALAAAVDQARTRAVSSPSADEILDETLRRRRFDLTHPAQAQVYGVEDLPPALRSRLVGRSGELLISAYGPRSIYDDQTNAKLLSELREDFPEIVGVPVLYADLLGLSRAEGKRSACLAFFLVFVAILVDMRHLPRTITTMVPLVVGVSWALGAMRLLGLDFNFVNVVAAPLLLGIGIDDGVHMMHRSIEEGSGHIARVLRHTGRAVLLTSLTTMIGFGVFELAQHRGLESLGRVMVIGVATCFLASVTAFPTLLALGERWRRRTRPASVAT